APSARLDCVARRRARRGPLAHAAVRAHGGAGRGLRVGARGRRMIRERIARFLRTGEGDFAELALALHAWQREHNADLAALVGDTPMPTRWEEIPAVPVSLFRDLALTSFDPARTAFVFRTSGTTSGRRGTVRLRDT